MRVNVCVFAMHWNFANLILCSFFFVCVLYDCYNELFPHFSSLHFYYGNIACFFSLHLILLLFIALIEKSREILILHPFARANMNIFDDFQLFFSLSHPMDKQNEERESIKKICNCWGRKYSAGYFLPGRKKVPLNLWGIFSVVQARSSCVYIHTFIHIFASFVFIGGLFGNNEPKLVHWGI